MVLVWDLFDELHWRVTIFNFYKLPIFLTVKLFAEVDILLAA